MTAFPNKHYSGHCRATEIEGDQRTHGKRSGETNVNSGFQVQLMEASAQDRQSWTRLK